MKNKFKYIISAFSLITLILIQGCSEDEFLNRYSKSQPSPDNFFVDGTSARLALNAAYRPWLQGGAVSLNRDMTIILDAMTDDSYWRPNRNPSIALEQWNVNATHTNVVTWWRNCYQSINAANFAIKNIPNSKDENFTELEQAPYIGEGLFLRAYNYLFLATFYEDVPLFIDIETEIDQFSKPLTPKAQILAQVASDFSTAASLLPPTPAVPGTPNKAAAYAFLAKTYLYLKEYEKAETAARAAVTTAENAGYGLQDDYLSIWSEEGNKELLFYWSYVANSEDYGQNMTVQRLCRDLPPALRIEFQGDGWGYSLPQRDLYDAFENGDPRREFTLYTPGDVYGVYGGTEPVKNVAYVDLKDGKLDTTQININTGDTVRYSAMWSPTGLNVRKMTRSLTDLANVRWDGLDIPALRMGEVYLLLAEALAEQGKDEALTWVNKVRSRASVNMPNKTTADGDLVDIVRHERRVELAMEGLRVFDLIRWGELANTFGDGTKVKRAFFSDFLPEGSSLKFDSPIGDLTQYPLFPTPQDEIDANDKIIQ